MSFGDEGSIASYFCIKIYNLSYIWFGYHYFLVVESVYTECLFYLLLEYVNYHSISQWMQTLYNIIVHVHSILTPYVLFTPIARVKDR
jgi:hypothetical protein